MCKFQKDLIKKWKISSGTHIRFSPGVKRHNEYSHRDWRALLRSRKQEARLRTDKRRQCFVHRRGSSTAHSKKKAVLRTQKRMQYCTRGRGCSTAHTEEDAVLRTRKRMQYGARWGRVAPLQVESSRDQSFPAASKAVFLYFSYLLQ